jgi:hypothetical protein
MNDIQSTRVPTWFWVAAALGLVWNLFGAMQFFATAGASVEALMKSGMTQAQADFYVKLPVWLHAAFAVGVFGGIIGCILLLLRKSSAVIVFLVSLVGYIALFIADAALGVFTVMGTPQVAILSSVVLIAALLLWMAMACKKRGYLH